jgi:hypothetical protein
MAWIQSTFVNPKLLAGKKVGKLEGPDGKAAGRNAGFWDEMWPLGAKCKAKSTQFL